MKQKYIGHIVPEAGDNIVNVAEATAALSRTTNEEIWTQFNGTTIVATPSMSADDILSFYYNERNKISG